MTTIRDEIQKHIDNLINNISGKKNEIIEYAFKNKGIDIDFIEEATKRFPNVSMDKKDGKEYWYYNDGTKKGEHIITIWSEIITEDLEDRYNISNQINISYKED